MKTPDVLLPALRQYQHNDCSGLISGFEHKETCKIVTGLQAKLRELAEAAEWRDEVLYDYEHEKSFFVFKTSQPTKEDWIRAENADKSFFSIKEAAEAAYQDALKAAEAPCSTTASSSPGC
jgi:hypothetical protein